jgi:hypothetical protein
LISLGFPEDSMREMMRRLRGVIGMGVIWGVAWTALGAAVELVLRAMGAIPPDGDEGPLLILRVLGTAGFISGAGFAAMLSFLERGRTIRGISLSRVAVCGTVIPLLTSVGDGLAFWTLPFGALLATSTILIARRVEVRSPDYAADPNNNDLLRS